MINSVTLVGNLGSDPEINYFDTGKCKATFRIAVPTFEKGSDGKYKSEWHNCEAWGQTAEFVAEHFRKGQKIGVRGQLRANKYEDQSGQTKTRVFVSVSETEFCSSKKDGD